MSFGSSRRPSFRTDYETTLHYIISSVGSNLVRFEVRFGFLRFGRFKVRFSEVREVQGSEFIGSFQV